VNVEVSADLGAVVGAIGERLASFLALGDLLGGQRHATWWQWRRDGVGVDVAHTG
jgi:hypothetical protein